MSEISKAKKNEEIDDEKTPHNPKHLGKGSLRAVGIDTPTKSIDKTDEDHEAITKETLQRIHELTGQLPTGAKGSVAENRHHTPRILLDEELGVGISVIDHPDIRPPYYGPSLSIRIATPQIAMRNMNGSRWQDFPDLEEAALKDRQTDLEERKDKFVETLKALGIPDTDKIAKSLQQSIDSKRNRSWDSPLVGFTYVIRSGPRGIEYGVESEDLSGQIDGRHAGVFGKNLSEGQGQAIAGLLGRTIPQLTSS